MKKVLTKYKEKNKTPKSLIKILHQIAIVKGENHTITTAIIFIHAILFYKKNIF